MAEQQLDYSGLLNRQCGDQRKAKWNEQSIWTRIDQKPASAPIQEEIFLKGDSSQVDKAIDTQNEYDELWKTDSCFWTFSWPPA